MPKSCSPRYLAGGVLLFLMATAGASHLAGPAGVRLGAQSGRPTKLVQSSDLVHQGSFTLPSGSDFEYTHGIIAFNPANNSLFVVGNDQRQQVAEVTIPALGGRAAVLQAFRDPLNGRIDQTNPSGADKKIGGILVVGNQLVISAYTYYDNSRSASSSHFVRSTNLSAGSVQGPFRVGTLNPGFYAGYMTHIPQAWQAALGGDVMGGQCCLSIISRTSFGPAAFAMNASALLSMSNAAAPLLYYPESNQTLGQWDRTSPTFNGTTKIFGAVIPEGTASALWIGKHGTGPYCYGSGSDCGDPVDPYQGNHAYPYRAQVWAYNLNDLAAVRSGSRQPWQVTPYSVWELPGVSGYEIGGVAVDPATGRIFVAQNYGNGNGIRIHVYTVSGGSSSPLPPADTAAPSVGVSSPGSSSVVSGTTTLRASASDNVGVSSVWFTVDGVTVGNEDTSAPYEVSWNSTSVANGTHTIRAVARDAAGNVSQSAPVTISVNNTAADNTAPSISLTSPSNGATVSGTVTVAASASDNVGVSSVQFTLNGVNLGPADTSAPYAISWNTLGAENGTHQLRAVARDAAGNERTSALRTVTVSNQPSQPGPRADDSRPQVSISTPSWNQRVSGSVTVSATASDNVGVTSVTFLVDGQVIGTDATSPYSITWNTRNVGNGTRTLQVTASDAAGNTRSTSRRVRVENTSIDNVSPSVALLTPAAAATVKGTVTVSASASDNVAVSSVQFTLNGVPLGNPDSSAPYVINWSTVGAADGTYALRAIARDAAGNTTMSAPRTVTVRNTSPTPVPAAPPPAASTCRLPDPFAILGGGRCVNGGWLPPGMVLPAAGSSGGSTGTPPAAPTVPSNTPSSCSTPRPGSSWTCFAGGWLPPGMTPPTLSSPPTAAPNSPAPPPVTGACQTPAPGAGWLCRNGGWLPPGHPER